MDGRRVPKGGGELRGEGLVGERQPRPQDPWYLSRGPRLDRGGWRGLKSAHVRANLQPGVPRHRRHLGRRHAGQRREELPLVGPRFPRRKVDEQGGAAVASSLPVQRRRDEVSHTARAGRDRVLVGEQPVVAGKRHGPAQSHRPVDTRRPHGPCRGRRHRRGEERPDVRAAARLGDLQPARHAEGVGGFDVGVGVEHGLGPVEVDGEPPARRVPEQRIQADEEAVVGAQVRLDHIPGQGEGTPVPQRTPTESVPDHRRPTLGLLARVLPVVGVDVGPGGEAVHVEVELGLLRRIVRHQPGVLRRERRLLRRRFDAVRDLQQVPEPPVLHPERRQPSLQVRLAPRHGSRIGGRECSRTC